jgi:hypothetical protein
MKPILNKLYNIFLNIIVYSALVWVVFALSFDIFFLYLHFSEQDDRARDISNEITWKLDGRFKETSKKE